MSALNGMPEGQRVLTADEVRAELQKMKLTKNCQPERIAHLFASGLALEGGDLLHDAVCRALTSRECRDGVTVPKFLNGIMRSIASTAKRAIERREGEHIFRPPEEIAERLGMGGYHVISVEQELDVDKAPKFRLVSVCQSLPALALGTAYPLAATGLQ